MGSVTNHSRLGQVEVAVPYIHSDIYGLNFPKDSLREAPGGRRAIETEAPNLTSESRYILCSGLEQGPMMTIG